MNKRIYGFDLFRGVGILLVVGYHALQLFIPYLPRIYMIGTVPIYGVECFFVLSGFLIGTILLKDMLDNKVYSARLVWRFYTRRWLRTLPAYFFVLLVLVLFYKLGNEPGDDRSVVKSFYFFQNFKGKASYFFPESWSLCIEEWFYLLLPALLFITAGIFRSEQQRRSAFVISAILFVICCVAVRIVLILKVNPDFETQLRKLTVLRLDAPLYGVIMAYIWKFKKDELMRKRYWLALSGFVLFILMVIIYKGYFGNTLKSITTFTLTGISFCLLLPWFYGLKDPSTSFSKVLVYFGKISYSLYLVHLSLVLFGMIQPLYHPTSFGATLLVSIVYFITSVIVAVFLHHIIEQPMIRWRNKNILESEK